MLVVTILLILIAIALLFIRSFREWLLEGIKELSDRLLLRFLLLTSRFDSELTEGGRAEQNLWREQRLRNLRGLALRSRERFRQSQS
jgi:hypothetical protein